ncbi:uncharacterized protein LOC104440978 [Eucalyptus grandis]|uniref:uncharacterized protein LOC104440978 n=1 Tax=Eucalyptus grandis TaxID=71139 RepID=UPI00192EF0F2|nr:uncharacterized protein LOC104440978 [Eucalyptus grandis]
MGIENFDKGAWVEAVSKLSTRAWIANSTVDDMFRQLGGLGDADPSTTAIKYISLLACFILAFIFFLQSARHFIHANFLISTQKSDSTGEEAVKQNAKVVIKRGGEFLSLGLRAIYFALALLLWFFGPVPMFVASAILVKILYHHDFLSIPLARPQQPKTRSGGVQ